MSDYDYIKTVRCNLTGRKYLSIDDIIKLLYKEATLDSAGRETARSYAVDLAKRLEKLGV